MLAETVWQKEYRVVYTGYPYPDTVKPQQDMIDDLLRQFHLYRVSRVTSVSQLADILGVLFDKKVVITDKQMKKLLKTGKLPKLEEQKDTGYYVFFDCKFFSVYYIDDIDFSSVFEEIKDQCIGTPGNTGGYERGVSRKALIFHSHKCKSPKRLGTPNSNKRVHEYEEFVNSFMLKFSYGIEELKNILNQIYDNLEKLDFRYRFLDSTKEEESLFCYPVLNTASDNMRSMGNRIAIAVFSLFEFWDAYKYKASKGNALRRTFEEIYGYDIFNMAEERVRYTQIFDLGVSCCMYQITTGEERMKYREIAKSLCDDFMVRLDDSGSRFMYTIKDGDIILYTSPYFGKLLEMQNLGMGSLYRQEDGVGLVNMPNGEKVYALNLGNRVRNVLTGYEYRLYQYFRLRELVIESGRNAPYFDGKRIISKHIRDGNEAGGTYFSYRGVLKTIKSNFDRLYLMGEYGKLSYQDILEGCYCYTFYKSERPDLYVYALDYAVGDNFTNEEKSFILMFNCMSKFNSLFSSMRPESLAPDFTEEFIQRLKGVLKIKLLELVYTNEDEVRDCLKNKVFCFVYQKYTLSGAFMQRKV